MPPGSRPTRSRRSPVSTWMPPAIASTRARAVTSRPRHVWRGASLISFIRYRRESLGVHVVLDTGGRLEIRPRRGVSGRSKLRLRRRSVPARGVRRGGATTPAGREGRGPRARHQVASGPNFRPPAVPHATSSLRTRRVADCRASTISSGSSLRPDGSSGDRRLRRPNARLRLGARGKGKILARLTAATARGVRRLPSEAREEAHAAGAEA